MKKTVVIAHTSICLLSPAYGIEYSTNVIAGDVDIPVDIDCPLEVQEKSKFMINARGVIAELAVPEKAFFYRQPKKRIRKIEGITDASPQVSLESDEVKNAPEACTFTVDNVMLPGWTYDPAANVETSHNITVGGSSGSSAAATRGIIHPFCDYIYRLLMER
jgi:hypothetical protein